MSIQRAFDPAASVFVSANAGAGKTSLLTNRVLSLLLHGVDPSKILCLTFTNAASAEMKSRVLKVLGEWIMADEQSLRSSLAHLLGDEPAPALMARARGLFATVLEAPEGVRIQTIHGFCQSLLRRFPIEASVSPHFQVMDSRTEQEMLQEARLRLFSEKRHDDPELKDAINTLASQASESGFHALLSEIVSHKRKFMALFHGFGGLESVKERLYHSLGVAEDATLEGLMQSHFVYDDKILSDLRRIAGILSVGGTTDARTGQGLAYWLEQKTPNLWALEHYTDTHLTQKGTPRAKLHTKDALTDPALIAALKAEQERVLNFNEARRALEVAHYSTHVLRLAEALLMVYDQLKRGRAGMDYDDLIVTASRLLKKEGFAQWILFKLDGGIDHVLVDEAQDTSPEQWAIIDALTQEFFAGLGRRDIPRSLFVVGDEKQSIYSFQGADVAALGRMQRYFSRRISEAAIPVHTLALTHSYRSTPEVLQAVDAIFARPEARAGLMFTEGDLAHIPTRSHPGMVELMPLVKPPEESMISASALLARQVADSIGRWIGEGAKPGDIMILVKSRTSLVDKLVRALKRRDIPVAGIDRMVLGENLAVQDLMALGQVLLLPEDDLTLAALLKSPLCNVSEERLFELAHGRGNTPLWERLRGDEVFDFLSDLRAKADYIAPFELYSYVLETLGGRARFTGRMGVEYNDPIDEFLNQALLYERSHTPSLQGFLHWLSASESEIKRDMEQSKNAVRIMTVHGAKGLQAPIVVLPDTTEPPRQKDRLLWHEQMPLWPRSTANDDALCRQARAAQRASALAEYRRLFYVALTRAEDRLYIFGASSRDKVSEESWYHLAKLGMEGIAQEAEGGLRLGTLPEMKAVASAAKPKSSARDFSFLRNAPPEEPVPTKPLSPSRLSGSEPALASPVSAAVLYQRGSLIHSLLQYLPEANPGRREALAKRLAASYPTLPAQVREAAIAEVMTVLSDARHAFLFAAGSKAEVPIAGNIIMGEKVVTVSGQLDRLCVGEKDVWVVDYKSNVAPPTSRDAIPPAYLRQMALYKRLLTAIYPEKAIRCALLWTANAAITELDEALLDEARLSTYI